MDCQSVCSSILCTTVDAGPLGTLIEKCWRTIQRTVLLSIQLFQSSRQSKNSSPEQTNIYKKKTGEIKEPQKIVEEADLQKTLTSLAKIQFSEDLIDEMASSIQNADFVRTLTENLNFVRTLLSA